MTRAHALLSASGAKRWMSCGPSARLEDELPESSSVYADEGTFLHSVVEHCLRAGMDVAQLCGVAPWEQSQFFTKENQEAAHFCIDFAREQIKRSASLSMSRSSTSPMSYLKVLVLPTWSLSETVALMGTTGNLGRE